MTCTSITLSGIPLSCGNTGGIKNIYISDVLNVTSVTENALTGDVDAITMVSGKTFAKYSFKRGNADMSKGGNKDDAAGTQFTETTVTAKFNHMDSATRFELQKLTKANTYVIVSDYNGKNWFIGFDSYCYGNVNGNTGANMGDANQYELILTSQTQELPKEISDALLVTIIA